MGNNNTTANLTEEESSKLETNGISPLDYITVESTQDQMCLAGEGKDVLDKQSDIFSDGVTGKETPETEPQSKELDEDPQVIKVEEDMSHNCLAMETYEKLQNNVSAAEGVESLCVSTKVEELSMIEANCVERTRNAEEYGNEEKPFVSDEIVFVSHGFYETAVAEEKLVTNESLEETAPGGKVDQAIIMEQRTGFPESHEILNLDNRLLDDDDEVRNERKADQEIPKPGSQGSKAILERMSRCRSLPVSNNSRVMRDSLAQELVSEVTYPSRNKTCFDKANTSYIPPVSCLTLNQVQETTEAITEISKEARLEMRSPSLSNELRIQEKSDEPIEETPLLSQDKTETFKELDVEEKTVMLKRSETEKRRGFELSLGLSMNLSGRCETDESFKETKSSGDNLVVENPKLSETLLVSCVGSKKAQDTTEVITESNKGDVLEMRSPSSGNDLRTKERSGESIEETSLLSQDKTETFKELDVEEKTVMLKRSETEKIRGFELSLGLSMNLSGRCDADDSFKEIKCSGDNLMDENPNMSENLLVFCVGSKKAQETYEVITNNKEDLLDVEKHKDTPLLCQDKTQTYEATIDVEEETVMLKRNESEKTKGFELSLGLSMKPGERSEAGNSLKENKDSGENLLDKKASWGSIKSRVRKRSKSSLFGTCLCCNITMN